ncbi:MAG: ABC transporter ATP-binding protein [Anaeroplasma sp.]|uniref:ABC transporter ATP-binding protein n=1 Tax=Anaeroplasma sp. TaxID=1872523 RepID=UPI002A915FC1|nr:ABC transporter ATP-binding protein [Anaeroplasma sp.]MDY5983495.1 ABC transporter ATP-binding protein [Anaeroplasma sp.]
MEDELNRLKGDHKMSVKEILSRTMQYVKPELLSFILAIVLLAINVALDITLPILTGKITDALEGFETLFGNSQLSYDNYRTILILSIVYFVIAVVNMAFIYIESMLLQKAGQRIIYRLRMDVFTHIQNMSQNQFNEMPVGSLVTRVCNYTQSMSDLFTNVIVNVFKNILYVVTVYAVMFFYSWKLSLIMAVPVIIVAISSFIFSKIVNRIFTKERKSISDMNTYLNENLSGMKITQIFNQQRYKDSEFIEKNDNVRKARFQVVLCFGIYRPFITMIYISSVAVNFYFGWIFAMSAGDIVAYYQLISRFFNPIQNLADQLNNLQKAFTASERLFNLMDVKPDVLDSEDAIEIDHFEGKIEFKHVWFAYEDEDWILKDVSFTILPKQTVAFVGATGAGKTTILSLIVRNYEIQKGQILIDDIDITHIKIESLRAKIGQMLQDVFLFSGSIRDNITLHDTKYHDDEIMRVCEYVNADSFIKKLPKGLDEEVIERGENFSQGQRQLLSFARTVLADPQILILDEATANIDTETEVLIQESLEKIKNIGTMLVVAHRLSTIQHADQIMVLQKGEIIEHGNHQELLAKHGYYYKLYKLQFEGKN